MTNLRPILWTATSACRPALGELHQRKTETPDRRPVGAGGMWPGVKPTPIQRKTSRLMHSLHDTTDAPPPPCPNCGERASSSTVRRQSGAITGDYLCPAGHIFTMRWMEVA